MTRKARSMKWTALALATAVVIAPVAYSGGKLPTFNKVPAAKAAASPKAAKLASAKLTQPTTTNRFIITRAPGAAAKVSAAAMNQQYAKAAATLGIGIKPLRTLATGSQLIKTDTQLDDAAIKDLAIELMKNDSSIVEVVRDAWKTRSMVPNDPGYAQQWHYKNGPGGLNLEPAWDIAKGDGIVVAVLDTGITPHSDLNANILPGYDFIDDPEVSVDGDGRDADPNDPGDWHDGECNIFGIPEDSSWHGTHVAGTIAAVSNNGVGVAGVAPNAKVQPVRVLGKCGGYTSDIIDAVTWASGGSVTGVPNNATPAEVINLSLGGSGACSAAEQTAFAAARARGTTVVIAAGNSSGDVANFSPANCDNVIAIAAVGPAGSLASYSNFGNKIDVAAPGGSGAQPAADNILSTLNLGLQGQEGEGYAWMAGTSMAAPHVAGVVALMQSAAATPKTPAEIEKILVNTAHVGGQPGGCSWSNWCGSGIVDARYAVAVAKGSEALPPDPQVPEPEPATELENGITVTNIEVGANGILRYQLLVPNGASNLLFAMYSGTGDSDIYVKYGAEPTSTSYDCRPFTSSNNETCFFPTPKGGVWYVQIKGYRASAGISLYPSFVDANYPRRLEAKASALPNHRTSVNLSWEKGKKNIDIWRNGAILKTVRNTGANTDTFRIIGSGTMSYKVCNNGTQECDDPVEITYNSSR
ncbi:S8 family serine peptidase [Lysobacter enzymogenes]|uniref:S8 family serine peptidase n=1 Tax=Lysobacter enzymogenes TaxID=69 RepID=UPI00089DA102|nr:S8 family peptidase [Lysobacter enzymogenes]SDX05522.1 serine protease [Lysobacter enzymogenes]